MPGVAVRTTFITGFPGETDEDFDELLAFVRNVGFDRVGVFAYSDEEGTPAFDLPGKVERRTAERRRARLMKEQARIRSGGIARASGDGARALRGAVEGDRPALAGAHGGTQAPDIDGCVLINDAPEDAPPPRRRLRQRLHHRGAAADLVGTIV